MCACQSTSHCDIANSNCGIGDETIVTIYRNSIYNNANVIQVSLSVLITMGNAESAPSKEHYIDRWSQHEQRSIVSLAEESEDEPLSSGDDWDHDMKIVRSRNENISPNHNSKARGEPRSIFGKPSHESKQTVRLTTRRSQRDPEESQYFEELADDSCDEQSEEDDEADSNEEDDDDDEDEDATSVLMEASAAVFHYLTTADAESGYTMSDDVSIAERSAAVFDYLKEEASYGNEKPMRQFLQTAQVVSDVVLKKQFNRQPPTQRYDSTNQRRMNRKEYSDEDHDELSVSQQQAAIFQALEHAMEEQDECSLDTSRQSPSMLQWLETKPDHDVQSVVSEMSTTIFKVLDDTMQKVDEESVAEFSEAVSKLLETGNESYYYGRKDDDTCSITERSAAIFKVLDRTAAPDVHTPTNNAKLLTTQANIKSPSIGQATSSTPKGKDLASHLEPKSKPAKSTQPLQTMARLSALTTPGIDLVNHLETKSDNTKAMQSSLSTERPPSLSTLERKDFVSHQQSRTTTKRASSSTHERKDFASHSQSKNCANKSLLSTPSTARPSTSVPRESRSNSCRAQKEPNTTNPTQSSSSKGGPPSSSKPHGRNVLNQLKSRTDSAKPIQPLPLLSRDSLATVKEKHSSRYSKQKSSANSMNPNPISIVGNTSFVSHLKPRTDPAMLMQRNIFHILAQRSGLSITTIKEVEDEELDDDKVSKEEDKPIECEITALEEPRNVNDNTHEVHQNAPNASSNRLPPEFIEREPSDDSSSYSAITEPVNMFSEVIHADSSEHELQDDDETQEDIDLNFVERFDHAFNKFIGLHPKFLLNNPTLVHHLRITKLQKLLKHMDVYHSNLRSQMVKVIDEKQNMEMDFQTELKESSREKAAFQIHLQSELTALTQKIHFKQAQMMWKIVNSSEARIKKDYIFRQHQKQKQGDFVRDNISGVPTRDEILELLPKDDEGIRLKAAIYAKPRFFSNERDELDQLRQYQVENAFMSSEIAVLKRKLSSLQDSSKRLSWVDSILLRIDKVQMAKLKNKYTKKLGIVSLE